MAHDRIGVITMGERRKAIGDNDLKRIVLRARESQPEPADANLT